MSCGNNGFVAPTYDVFFELERRPGDASIEYRAGALEDVEDIAQLMHGVYGGDLEGRRASISRALEREDSVLVVAHCFGVVVGYGKAAFCEPTSAEDQAPTGHYLTGLVVDSAWRRCGIGAELIRRRTAWIWSRDRSAWCFANAGNQASIDLHAALGFTEVARAASYLGEPFKGGHGVLMRADPPSKQSDGSVPG